MRPSRNRTARRRADHPAADFGFVHQALAEVVEFADRPQAGELIAHRSNASRQSAVEFREPVPICLRRHDPHRIIEFSDAAEHGVGRASWSQLGDVSRDALAGYAIGGAQVEIAKSVCRKPEQPVPIAASGLEARRIRPAGAHAAAFKQPLGLDALLPQRAVALRPVSDGRAASHVDPPGCCDDDR